MPMDGMHEALEVIPCLILGSLRDLNAILDMHPDVLVPLDRLPGWLWDGGWRGEILYCPVTDYGILPDDVLDRLVEDVLQRMDAGKRAAILCVGGHGRTGYVAACVLYRKGIENPIAFLRRHYSLSAVESEEQEDAVVAYCRRFAERGGVVRRLVRHILVKDIDEVWEDAVIAEKFRAIDESLGPGGRILLRRADHPPMLRVLVEAPVGALCEKAMEEVFAVLREKDCLAQEKQ